MKHAHEKYDGVQDAGGVIPDDEPVFLLRATDPMAVETIKYWIRWSRINGVNMDNLDGVTYHLRKMHEYICARRDDRKS